jgi:hypothetical protein
LDITKGEATEKELDALISRRHDRRVVEEGERGPPRICGLRACAATRNG